MPNFNLDGLKFESLDCIVMGLPFFYRCYGLRLLFLVVILRCWNFAHEEQKKRCWNFVHEEQKKAYILEGYSGIVAYYCAF